MPELRELLRSLPVFAGELPGFDVESAPPDPHTRLRYQHPHPGQWQKEQLWP